MNEFVSLNIPVQQNVFVDSQPKDCPSAGFDYPSFRLINKNARVYLSSPIQINPTTSYHLFAVANSKGWFVAVKSAASGSELILSPLDHLRTAIAEAKEDDESLFVPKRTLAVPILVNSVNFGCGDTRLLVGFEDGSVAVYDTSLLFIAGAEDLQPLKRHQIQSSPLRQIVPNPSVEPMLRELFAVVGDSQVQLLNMQLDIEGGWSAGADSTQPVAADWSPKGKHLAIGLITGDILTYSLTNKTSPHVHVPSTFRSRLSSLSWLGPKHTFRVSYSPQNGLSATQHILNLETKTSKLSYWAPDHPFCNRDQTSAYVVNLPKWDADSGTSVENKCLTIIGDISSVDLEVLGSDGDNWHREARDNPWSLPLDKSLEDTILLALEADLTDNKSLQPIVYAYLNDGSLQGWYLDHSKSYVGILALNGNFGEQQSDMDVQQPSNTISAFAQLGSTGGAFGQPLFGQQPGTVNQPAKAPSTIFGQPTHAFSNLASSNSNFFGQGNFSMSLDSSTQSLEMTREASMSDTTPNAPSTSVSGFGGMSLGTSTPSNPNAANSMFGSTSAPSASKNESSAFGGPLIKPAAGFGAFSNYQTGNAFQPTNSKISLVNAFSTSPPPTAPTTSSGFGQSGFASPAFGKPGFGQPSFAQLNLGVGSATGAFGGFGSTAQKQGAKAPISGGFGAFASAPATFSSALGTKDVSEAKAIGGFSVYASKSTSFVTSMDSTNTTDAKTSTGGFSTFASSSSAIAKKETEEPKQDISAKGNAVEAWSTPASTTNASSPATPPPPPTVGDAFSGGDQSSVAPSSGLGAFSNLKASPSPFKPAEGFGLFGSLEDHKDSPFFKRPGTTPSISAFGPLQSPPKTPTSFTSAPTFGSTSALGPPKSAFATTLSPSSSSPVASSSAFDSFKGTSSAFGVFAGPKKSFSELLKTGGEVDLVKSSTSDFASPRQEEEQPEPHTSIFGTPTTKAATSTTPTSVFPIISKSNEKETSNESSDKTDEKDLEASKTLQAKRVPVSEEPSYGNISSSSGTSSFVDVAVDQGQTGDQVSDEDADGEEDDARSFLSDNFSDGYQDGDSAYDSDAEDNASPPEPSSIPLPSSRSTSSTPQPDTPVFKILPPLDGDDAATTVKSSPKRELSATPPGSPHKDAKPLFGSAPLTVPSGTTSIASSFSLGLGKPSSRPSRSSPLAKVLPVEEEEEDTDEEDLKPRSLFPVSPKPVHDVLPTIKEEQEVEVQKFSKRPKTPPLLSTFSPKISSSLPFSLTSQHPSSVSAPSLLGVASDHKRSPSADIPRASTAPPLPVPAIMQPLHMSNLASVNLNASKPSTFADPLKGPDPGTPSQAMPTLFGPIPPPLPTMSTTPMQMQMPVPFGSPVLQVPQLSMPDVEEVLEDGMQREAFNLVKEMNEQLIKLADSTRKVVPIEMPALTSLRSSLRQVEANLDYLLSEREKKVYKLREVQSSMLKAGTKKEETARFLKAYQNKEFEKMLKARSLGPEYSESQKQLRKKIHGIQDRVEKLESRLKELKRKKIESKTLKPVFKAPTLDTINRALRNIETVIDQQSEEVARLSKRISLLSVTDRRRLMEPTVARQNKADQVKVPLSPELVTDLQARAARALNSEMRAQNLKVALLAVRKEPLLNASAVAAPTRVLAFNSPKKPAPAPFSSSSVWSFAFQAPIKESLFSGIVSEFDIPNDNNSPPSSVPHSRRSVTTRKHQILKRTTPLLDTPPPVAPTGFDWGPLPSFATPPSKGLPTPFSLTPIPPKT